MNFKRHFTIKKIDNNEVDIAGKDELQKTRIVTLEKGALKITLKGEREQIEGFKTGDNVEVRITNSQTELFKVGGDIRMTEVCPVCGGRGTVAQGFYEGVEMPTTTNTQRETCRARGGRGILE